MAEANRMLIIQKLHLLAYCRPYHSITPLVAVIVYDYIIHNSLLRSIAKYSPVAKESLCAILAWGSRFSAGIFASAPASCLTRWPSLETWQASLAASSGVFNFKSRFRRKLERQIPFFFLMQSRWLPRSPTAQMQPTNVRHCAAPTRP